MSNPKVLFKTLKLRCLKNGEMPQIITYIFPVTFQLLGQLLKLRWQLLLLPHEERRPT
jgi:hypothetical protein